MFDDFWTRFAVERAVAGVYSRYDHDTYHCVGYFPTQCLGPTRIHKQCKRQCINPAQDDPTTEAKKKKLSRMLILFVKNGITLPTLMVIEMNS